MKLEGKQAIFIKMINDSTKHVLVEAPAGTGKTFCCMQATKVLCDNGYLKPFQKVLILTFSRNARAQLLKELSCYPAQDDIYKHVEVNNYHSFFKKYIDVYRDTIGIKESLSIVDDDEYIEGLIEYSRTHSITIEPNIKCDALDDFSIESGKLILLNNKSKLKKTQFSYVEQFIRTAYEYTKSTGTICFDQFGCLVYRILHRLPNLAQAISHDYPVLILDEYQDTNFYQEAFVEAILKKSRGIFFGDRFQMIYEFRGSSLARLDNLSTLYSELVKIEFDEYYRYKDKQDLVNLLTEIRNNQNINYYGLIHGKVILFSIDCDNNWRKIKNEASHKAQCTTLCKEVFFNVVKIVSTLLRQHKSVAVLCRMNIEADRLESIFREKNFHPKTISDTKNMALACRHLKKCLSSSLTVGDIVSNILAICLLCTSAKQFCGEKYDDIVHLDIDSLKRKKKDKFKEIKELILPYQNSSVLQDKWNIINSILNNISHNGEMLNYALTSFILQCLKITEATPEKIDKILLQRQYTNSFTNITPGLYITTIHQSKGKEFDHVFVLDVYDIITDRNLLYVSHSRMKEALYPIIVKYNGRSFVK